MWQPYASAIAYGQKCIETRGFDTRYRGPLLIHAALKDAPQCRTVHRWATDRGLLPAKIPYGAIVAYTELVATYTTDQLRDVIGVTTVERQFGDFTTGRFGWRLANVKRFAEPIPWKGSQGFFNVPESMIADALTNVIDCGSPGIIFPTATNTQAPPEVAQGRLWQ